MPAMMAVHVDVPAKTSQGVHRARESETWRLPFSSSGNGSVPQLFGEQFKIVTGTQLSTVPYKGSGPAVVGLASGEAHVMWDGLPSLIGQIKGGRSLPSQRCTASASPFFRTCRLRLRLACPGWRAAIRYGLSGPPGIAQPIVERLDQEIAHIGHMPDAQVQPLSVVSPRFRVGRITLPSF